MITKYIKRMTIVCETMSFHGECDSRHCEECMLEMFLELVKECVYYYDDLLDFLKEFRDDGIRKWDPESGDGSHCGNDTMMSDCLRCFYKRKIRGE